MCDMLSHFKNGFKKRVQNILSRFKALKRQKQKRFYKHFFFFFFNSFFLSFVVIEDFDVAVRADFVIAVMHGD